MSVQNNPLAGGPLGLGLGILTMMTTDSGFRSDALTTEVGELMVDTVCPSDSGLWETGIKRGLWIIVEQYANDAAARVGHAKWVAACEADPLQKFVDVFYADMGIDPDDTEED